jgi:LmbE family N-acetylglucosaminyl deacetylase
MRFHQPTADVYVPQLGVSPEQALARTTDLCIAAHQDDIEIMAYSAIAESYGRDDRWFSGVVVTNGAGSPRHGRYANYTDEQMQAVRREEQRKAAHLGDYSIQLQLAHPSSAVKTPSHPGVQDDLAEIFALCRPETVFLHQPADKHDTHIGVLVHCLQALRALPAERRPKKVLGCEVWRDLDWLVDSDKVALDSGQHPHLSAALVGVFDSQIGGGKRYDLATAGRRSANATFHTSHATDRMAGITWAMDLTPLVVNPKLDLAEFTLEHVERLKRDIADRIGRFSA